MNFSHISDKDLAKERVPSSEIKNDLNSHANLLFFNSFIKVSGSEIDCNSDKDFICLSDIIFGISFFPKTTSTFASLTPEILDKNCFNCNSAFMLPMVADVAMNFTSFAFTSNESKTLFKSNDSSAACEPI